MNQSEKTTWEVLQSFQIDNESSKLKFSDRLARENGWTKEFAIQTIEEYKKFVFLAKHAGHPVTPSLEVDEAWHLHMIYTRSYWLDMCISISFQLHHGPTKGGRQEDEKFNDWYEKTLESYRKYFGEPPVSHWPPANVRFAPSRIAKVNKNEFFVIKKPKFTKMKIAACSILPLSILLLTEAESWWVYGIIIAIAVIVIGVFIYKYNKDKNDRNGRGGSGSGTSSSGCGIWPFFCGTSSGCSSSSGESSSGSSGCGSSCGSSCGGGCGGGCGS